MSDRYERVYDVGLLDDLHNYFPALLYNQELFRTVPDVLTYIRQRTQRRFNLYDYGNRQYQNTFVQPPLQPPVQAPVQTPIRTRAPYVEEVRVEFNPPSRTVNTTFSSILPLLRSFTPRAATAGGAAAGAGLYEDVIVHASQDIINGASTETTLLLDMDDNCAICQDRMRQGELVRKLTACEHSFHRACVDNWLLRRSVRCPTCRHDVREPTVSPGIPTRRSLINSPSLNPMEQQANEAYIIDAALAALGQLSPLDSGPSVENMLPNDLINTLFGRSLGQ
jgi:hypothetical protein